MDLFHNLGFLGPSVANFYSPSDSRGKAYQQRPKKPEKQFDPIPMSYAQLLPRLLELQLAKLHVLGLIPAKVPLVCDDNARREFHSGALDYSIKDRRELKYKVQHLSGIFSKV